MPDVYTRNWRCWLYGHRPDPIAADHGYWDCQWCGTRDDRPVAVVRFDGLAVHFWQLWWRLRNPLWRWVRSHDRCPVCRQPERWGCMAWCDYDPIPF